MNTAKLVGTGVFFLVIFASGYWLNRLDRPYPFLQLQVHKLVALAALVYLILAVVARQKTSPLQALELAAVIAAGVLFAATIVSGGLVSIDKAMPAAMGWAHKILPYLTAITTAGALFLLAIR